MKSSSVTSGTWRFAPDILRRLGEELIPNPEQGIIELVKNSYDADATGCCVELSQVLVPGGTIAIEDNGNGMDETDLLDGFLLIGRSRKSPGQRTSRLQRLPVGDKGLGRLAALRLGTRVIVRSRPIQQPGVELTMEIDWEVIDRASAVENVSLNIVTSSTDKQHGVSIEIQNLRNCFNEKEAKRLARELLLLSDPFKQQVGFFANLKSQDFADLERRVENSYFPEAEFVLKAHIESDGTGEAVLYDAFDVELHRVALPLQGEESYSIPEARFQLWIYLLGATNFTAKTVSVKEVSEWLKAVGGVHTYHRGLRVRPYGDPGTDWLDMNLARAQHPEFRPSTNTVIGRVEVRDPDLCLEQPTNRIGFVENETFHELRRFARDVVDWSSSWRLKEAEARRQKTKVSAPQEVRQSFEKVQEVIENTLSAEVREPVKKAFTQFVADTEKEVLSLREELQLYRSLATAGTTSVVFAHETAKPLSILDSATGTIETRGRKQLGKRYETLFEQPIENLRHVSSSLTSYSQFPIHHLRRTKRRTQLIDVSQVWEENVALFKSLLDAAKIDVGMEFEIDGMEIRASIALVEAIATNLLTNSIYALTKPDAPLSDRKVCVRGRVEAPWIIVTHSDNGSGIRNIDLNDIWLPGKSTKPDGTGFGLTIVKDTVNDLRGKILAKAKGELGGAEFEIFLPFDPKSIPDKTGDI